MLLLVSNLSIFPPNPSHHGLGIQQWLSMPIPRCSSPIPRRLLPISGRSLSIPHPFSSASVHTAALDESFLATGSVETALCPPDLKKATRWRLPGHPFVEVTTIDLISTGEGTWRALAGVNLMLTPARSKVLVVKQSFGTKRCIFPSDRRAKS